MSQDSELGVHAQAPRHGGAPASPLSAPDPARPATSASFSPEHHPLQAGDTHTHTRPPGHNECLALGRGSPPEVTSAADNGQCFLGAERRKESVRLTKDSAILRTVRGSGPRRRGARERPARQQTPPPSQGPLVHGFQREAPGAGTAWHWLLEPIRGRDIQVGIPPLASVLFANLK